MYTVYLDGNVLYDPRVEGLDMLNTHLRLEVNKVGLFDFRIYPTHPLYASVQKLKSVIEVYQDNVLIFRGRAVTDTMRFDKAKDIECEGDLAFFNDSIVRPYTFNGSISDYLQMIINEHNGQVEVEKRFTLGTVTVTDPNNFIVRSNIRHVKSWDEINDKLLTLLGGYIRVRRSGGVNYIDYLIDSSYMSTQAIELGQNLLDVIKETRSDDIITALIPLGARIVDAEGNETDERVSIESVNGGVDYVFNQNAVDQYGWIFDTKTWDGVTDPNNLLTRANQELAVRINLGVSVELNAIDLSMMDVAIDEIHVFEYVQVKSEPHGIDQMALITKLNIDLLSPENNTVTFGFNYDTFTDKQFQTESAIRRIESDYVTNDSVTEVRNSLVTLESAIEQTAEQIRMEVSENYVETGSFTQYQNQVSTQFTQTSTDYTYLFTQLEQYVQTLDGETQAQFTEIIKYIRFVNGTIELGEVNNPIKLVISNDRISFLQNGAEVAYISDNTLYITDGRFLNSLRIGNFAFTPRSNGSLSFGKVV